MLLDPCVDWSHEGDLQAITNKFLNVPIPGTVQEPKETDFLCVIVEISGGVHNRIIVFRP